MRPLRKRIIDIGLSLHWCINYSNVHSAIFAYFQFKKPSNKKNRYYLYGSIKCYPFI